MLHSEPKPTYNAGHAIWWCLQCAEGVKYLHDMRLVHRSVSAQGRIGCRWKVVYFGQLVCRSELWQ